MKLRFNFLALNTFQRLIGASAFVNLLDEAMPSIELRETEDLKQFAENEGWDYSDYQDECDVLSKKFRYWMPRFAAYSCAILLYSIVETQLQAYAEQVGRQHNSVFQVQDMRGCGVKQTTLYLNRVAGIDVAQDPSWKHIDNLRQLRNLIVHWGGRPSKSKEHQNLIERLSNAYPGYISMPDDYWPPHNQVWVSMRLCSQFATEIEAFFKRLFHAAGFSEKGAEFVP